jgi:hypothetical protein
MQTIPLLLLEANCGPCIECLAPSKPVSLSRSRNCSWGFGRNLAAKLGSSIRKGKRPDTERADLVCDWIRCTLQELLGSENTDTLNVRIVCLVAQSVYNCPWSKVCDISLELSFFTLSHKWILREAEVVFELNPVARVSGDQHWWSESYVWRLRYR